MSVAARVQAPSTLRVTRSVQVFEATGVEVRSGERLSAHTTFEIGGPARFFASPTAAEEVGRLAARAQEAEIPIYVLGGGSNLLVDDAGVPGLVLHLTRLRACRIDGGGLHVGPGYPLPGLVNFAASHGLAGFERFAGIPGCVGGMLRTNTGGRHGTLSDVLVSAVLLHEDGRTETRQASDFQFGHRRSNLGSEIALELVFRADPDDPERVRARRDEIMRTKIASQPLNGRSAGCVFRNPPGEHASRLIDQCGLKGARIGDARVSPAHANFICNEGAAAASDVRRLIERVRQTVRERTGVELDLEIMTWP
ncbi:MAG: UDP-N-acetylmuramate dehydrogenase [Planctomycetes bacterium]|nr:UDP-N-acetylmuramate dehydrogenase [Planctomycetota bacterium]